MTDAVHEEPTACRTVGMDSRNREHLHRVTGAAALRPGQLLPRSCVLIEMELVQELAEVGPTRAHDPLREQREQVLRNIGALPLRETEERQETVDRRGAPQVAEAIAEAVTVLKQPNGGDEAGLRVLPCDDHTARRPSGVPGARRCASRTCGYFLNGHEATSSG